MEDRIARARQIGARIELVYDLDPAEVGVWLNKVRVLLVTSRNEDFGRMAIEAMAHEIPVVTRAVGGLRESVEDGETIVW